MDTEGIELWVNTFVEPAAAAETARRIEQAGFDGVSLVDNQAVAGSPFVLLGVMGAVTSALRLGTGTSNPVTRHAAVLANAAATISATSGGRMMLSVGRGLSANFEIGMPPAPLVAFERYLAALQAYPHPDLERAIAIARGPVSGLASLSGMAGNDGTGQRPEDRAQFELINQVYDKRRHVWSSSPQAEAMDPSFVERFAAVGPVDTVVTRLRSIVAAGVTRLHLSFAGPDNDPDDVQLTNQLLAEEVVPALRSR